VPAPGPIEVPRDCHLVHFLIEGRVRLRVSGPGFDRAEATGPGGVTVVPAGGAHAFGSDGPARAVVCLIDPTELRALVDLQGCGPVTDLGLLPQVGATDPRLWVYGEALHRELSAPGALGTDSYVQVLHLGLAIQLLRACTAIGRQHDRPPGRSTRLTFGRLARAKAFIEQHLAENFPLLDLAEAVGVSPFHFARMFKGSVGVTPHQYLIQVRIERAKQLLERGTLPLIEIALQVGFSSQSHLTAVFRKTVGLTPAVYRERCRADGADGADPPADSSEGRVPNGRTSN
jgi:AraC family transcriptional regulator